MSGSSKTNLFTNLPFVDMGLISRLSAIPIVARRSMQGNVSGRHTSASRGSSVEFAEYRKYVPGDDLRRLDWRAYGRSDRFFIKEYEADTNLRCILAIDQSGSMDFGSVGQTKIEYAKKLAATLAYLAIQQGDAAGLAAFHESNLSYYPPRRNPAYLSTLMDGLSQIKPQGSNAIVAQLHELAEQISQRALVILFSDLFVDPDELRSCMEHLRFRKHDVVVFHLLDPEEIAFDFQRPTRFVDMETKGAMFCEPIEIADRYQSALNNYLESVIALMQETATDYHCISIDSSHESTLKRFLTGPSRVRGSR